jgi:hypothetical protein
MVLAIGFLLLVSLIISAALAAAGRFFGGVIPIPPFVLEGLNLLVSVAFITVLFALIFRFLPDERVPWKDVWLGAFVTSLLFALGKFLIGVYLGKASVGSAYLLLLLGADLFLRSGIHPRVRDVVRQLKGSAEGSGSQCGHNSGREAAATRAG